MRAGLLFPLSGTGAAWGRECLQGARAAVARRNGVTAIEADALDPGAAARLVGDEGTTLVIGTLFTALALRASRIVLGAGAAYLEVAAVAAELGGARFLRTAPRAAAFGLRAMEFAATELGARRVALFQEDSAFGRGLGDALAAAAARLGVAVAVRADASPEALTLEGPIGALRAARADVILAASYTETAQRLWAQLRAAHAAPAAMIGVGGGWLHLGEGPHAVSPERVYAVDVAPADALAADGLHPDVRLRLAEYRRAYRDASGAAASVYRDLAFTGADLVLDAFVGAGGAPAEFVRRARTIDVPDGGTILGYGARFDAAGENERALPVVMQHRGGSLPVVYPPRFATAAPDRRAP